MTKLETLVVRSLFSILIGLLLKLDLYCLILIQPQITVNQILKLISGAFVASKESVSLQFPEGRFYEPIG